MRWVWIDSFKVFESGRRAVAVKSVSLAEEHLHDHVPGFPVMPACLMIEGMAQTAGILCGEARGFRDNVILAKIRRATFDGWVRPGDALEYEARIETLDESGAMTTGEIRVNGRLVGNVDLVFSHVGVEGRAGAPKENFVFNPFFMELYHTFVRPAKGEGGG